MPSADMTVGVRTKDSRRNIKERGKEKSGSLRRGQLSEDLRFGKEELWRNSNWVIGGKKETSLALGKISNVLREWAYLQKGNQKKKISG